MQRISKVFTLMSAILALAFCLASCKANVDDDPTMYTVTVSSSIEHGKVSVDKTSAEAGATVKLTATADSGYELDSYSAKDASANALTITDGTFTMPKINVTVSATFKETAETVNQKAAAAVIAKITAIGTVAYTDESKAKIDDARTAYDALTETQKALVPAETLALLTAAESTYAELKAAAEQQSVDPETATYTVKHLQQNIADDNYTLKESETKTGTVGQPTAASAKSYDGFTAQSVTQATIAASGTEVEIKYDRKSYTVTFNTNGGSTVTSQSVRYGATATKPADPTKTATTTTEYTFADWYSDSDLTTSFSFDTAIKEDITLYAKWTETAVTTQKTAGSISYATASVSKTTDDAAFTNALTKTGDGTVTYASSKETVATVNATTGEVTIKGAGETTITATVADSESYTYAVKTASYTLTITQAVTYIGSKAPTEAKAVGDIVFSDGSATAYTSELTLTNEQKSKAVAVIFYAGSASDTLGAKTLGVGLKNATGSGNTLQWARYTSDTDKAEGYSTNITAIQCTPSESGSGKAATATFTGDTDGSDNWQALCDAVSDEGTSGNYPAWEWVNAYATENSLAGSYANGWYLPTLAELSMLYRVKDTVNSALEKASGTKIADEGYWSSSQNASANSGAWDVLFGDGYLDNLGKDYYDSVCTVRAF